MRETTTASFSFPCIHTALSSRAKRRERIHFPGYALTTHLTADLFPAPLKKVLRAVLVTTPRRLSFKPSKKDLSAARDCRSNLRPRTALVEAHLPQSGAQRHHHLFAT